MKANSAVKVNGSTTGGQQSDPYPLDAPKLWSLMARFNRHFDKDWLDSQVAFFDKKF